MAFSSKLVSTVLIQALGPLLSFLAVWTIGRELGAETQGKYSAVKSFVDLLLSILVFGLPQSFIYGINRLGVERGRLIQWTLKYGVFCLCPSTILICILRQFEWGPLELLQGNTINIVWLVLSVSGLVMASLLRGVLLTITDNWSFSLLSIVPSVSVSICAIFLVLAKHFDPLFMYMLGGILSALAGMWFVRKKFSEISNNDRLPWRGLLFNGGAVFLQGVLMSFQPFVSIALIRQHGGGYAQVAFFSLGMYIYQAGIVPLTMVTPILFNRWTQADRDVWLKKDLSRLMMPIVPLMLLLLMTWIILPMIIDNVFGAAYRGSVPVIRLMLVAIPMLYIVHVGLPVIMSQGLFITNIVLVGSKLGVCIVSLMLLLSGSNALAYQAAKAWLIAEVVMAFLVAVVVGNIYRSRSKAYAS